MAASDVLEGLEGSGCGDSVGGGSFAEARSSWGAGVCVRLQGLLLQSQPDYELDEGDPRL